MKPQWVDIQVNGRHGVPFRSPSLTVEQVIFLTEKLRDEGTAAYVPALTTTTPPETAVRNVRVIVEARRRSAECARRILGIHFEGPFISSEPGYAGAHAPAFVRDPDVALIDRYQDAAEGLVKMVTIAAEAKGAEAFTRAMTERGIVVSIGHSAEWRPEAIGRLADAGARSFTHLGNGIPKTIPRHNNIIFTGLAEDRMSVQFIPDGFHLPMTVLRVFTRAVPLRRLIAVSGCSFPGGLPPGIYDLDGDKHILEPDGFLRAANGLLHGSSCCLADAVRILQDPYIGFTERECHAVAFENPLRLIGMEGWRE